MENIQERRNLYTYSEAFEEGYMKVSDLHTIFYEVSGKHVLCTAPNVDLVRQNTEEY